MAWGKGRKSNWDGESEGESMQQLGSLKKGSDGALPGAGNPPQPKMPKAVSGMKLGKRLGQGQGRKVNRVKSTGGKLKVE